MRVVIFGGREWDNQDRMNAELDRLHAEHTFTRVINGGQVSRAGFTLYGADWQASVWAVANNLPIDYFYANWQAEGKAAGPIRNQRMIREGAPALGIQFSGGKGTRDMRRRLDAAGIHVLEVCRD